VNLRDLKFVDSTPRWRIRLLPRIWRHHLPLFIISFVCVATLYQTRPYPDILSRASFATAYPALALLTITLLIGPWNLLVRKPNPVSSDLRRDVGIWAGLLGILHAGVGQFVHLRGRPWLYYIYGPTEHHNGMRHDLFGLANYTGALGTLILIGLLATSNDFSLRKFGKQTWKQLQRWNYAIFALIAVHSFAFQGVETQKVQWVITVAICVLAALALQISGFIRHAAD
jgi:sulfoxide reductase heme-binding subunit YedZ